MKILALNKRANFDYEIFEKFEAGIVLSGDEVKSAKAGGFNIAASYAQVKDGEIWLINSEISPYQPKNISSNYDPKRTRKLLLHKKEIKYLGGKLTQKFMLIPLRVYLKNNFIKLELGLARPRKKYDKREIIKKREAKKLVKEITK
jgi:SsrA-binding protein